jgi:hypothetical protein
LNPELPSAPRLPHRITLAPPPPGSPAPLPPWLLRPPA